MEPHLQKIKLLLNLAKSPNENEAANAAAMALKLIEKFNVTDEQLAEIDANGRPIYTEDNLMLDTPELADWKNILALAVANKYDCYAIQEENVASSGERTYKYFVYGEEDDVAIAKELFSYVYGEMLKVIETKCTGRGELYRDSFCEGLVNGVKINIEFENFTVSGIVKTQSSSEEIKKDVLAPIEKAPIKPPAIDKKTKVTNKEKPLDIMAYFVGEGFGRDIHIGKFTKSNTLPTKMADQLEIGDLAKLFKG